MTVKWPSFLRAVFRAAFNVLKNQNKTADDVLLSYDFYFKIPILDCRGYNKPHEDQKPIPVEELELYKDCQDVVWELYGNEIIQWFGSNGDQSNSE